MFIKIIIPIVFSSLLFAACCNCGKANSSDKISDELKMKADSFVISKTGKDFFTKYIKPDYNKITPTKDGYLMVYNFSIPDKEDIKGEIRFSIDTLGNVFKNKEIAGIPGCIENPDDCTFSKNKEDVIRVAYAVDFKEGIKEWDISFVWSTSHNHYVWEVRSTLEETQVGDRFKSNGLILLVDPNSGNVIQTKEWRVN